METLLNRLAVVLLAAAASALLFWNLGGKYLWQDEAATAVLGERMLRYGRPLAYDGKNLITMDSFADEDPGTIDGRTSGVELELRYLVARGDFKSDTTWVGQPWGQFALAGLSLAVFGHGTAAARLPFAIAGLATVLLLYVFAVRVFADRAMALLASALLLANCFWVLHVRQCRYYALSSLALMATVAAFTWWRQGGRRGAALFVLAGWVYFQCDFGSFFPTMAVLGLLALAGTWPRPGRAIAVFAVLGAAVAPFAWYYGIVGRIRNTILPWSDKFVGNLVHMNHFVIPFLLLAPAGYLLWRTRATLSRQQREVLAGAIGMILLMLLWVPTVAPWYFHRYIVQLTPLASIVVAWVVVRAANAPTWLRARPWARAGTIVAVGAAVAVSAVLPYPIDLALARWSGIEATPKLRTVLLRGELEHTRREIAGSPPDPNREVIEWVKHRLRDGDEILVNYEDIPFMFYTDAAVRGGVAAFRVEDRAGPPPRFLVLRRSVSFVHWPVFLREAKRHSWSFASTGAPDVPFGNNPDPDSTLWQPRSEVLVGERVGP